MNNETTDKKGVSKKRAKKRSKGPETQKKVQNDYKSVEFIPDHWDDDAWWQAGCPLEWPILGA